MVEGVDVDGGLTVEYVAQHGVWSDVHAVCLGGLMRCLRVLDKGRGGLYVLLHVSAQCHCECLYAAADAEHGQLTVEGVACEEQFGQVALVVDVVQLWHRLFACPERIEVATAAQNYSVEGVESSEQNVVVSHRRNEYGCASGSDYLLVVDFAQRGVDAFVISGDAYDWSVGV